MTFIPSFMQSVALYMGIKGGGTERTTFTERERSSVPTPHTTYSTDCTAVFLKLWSMEVLQEVRGHP